MAGFLTDDEFDRLARLPEEDLVNLAIALDVSVPEHLDMRALLDLCAVAFCARGPLPFSKYDADDLEALPPDLLAAIAALQGVRGSVSVAAVLKVGKVAYRPYETKTMHPVPMMLPMMLHAVARAAIAMGKAG
jgi:hypothetical protein